MTSRREVSNTLVIILQVAVKPPGKEKTAIIHSCKPLKMIYLHFARRHLYMHGQLAASQTVSAFGVASPSLRKRGAGSKGAEEKTFPQTPWEKNAQSLCFLKPTRSYDLWVTLSKKQKKCLQTVHGRGQSIHRSWAVAYGSLYRRLCRLVRYKSDKKLNKEWNKRYQKCVGIFLLWSYERTFRTNLLNLTRVKSI